MTTTLDYLPDLLTALDEDPLNARRIKLKLEELGADPGHELPTGTDEGATARPDTDALHDPKAADRLLADDLARALLAALRENTAATDRLAAQLERQSRHASAGAPDPKQDPSTGMERPTTEDIASQLGLRFERRMNRQQLRRIIQPRQETISKQEQANFEHSMVLQTKDKDNKTTYVVIEVAQTADLAIIHRAYRKATYLIRFTGHSAHPVVVSVWKDPGAEDALKQGGLATWIQAREEDFLPPPHMRD